MLNRKFLMGATGLLAGSSMLLSACGTGATPTAITVIQTQIVTVQGTDTVKEVVVTATPDPNAGGGDTTEKAKVLRINLGAYPDTIDPQKSSFVNEIAHLKLMYEGLTKFDTQLATVPGAAEKWEYNEDLTELTFTIRKDLKYSNGDLLNAKRFEYAILRNIDPATAGEYASITDEIMGAPEWRASDGTDEALKAAVGVKATHLDGSDCTADAAYDDADCLLLTLTLSKPAPYFHTIMGIWVAYPAREESISDGGDNWWLSTKYQIGNGPFIWKTSEPSVRSFFAPNENYWGGTPKVGIEYSYIVEAAVAFEAYQNDELDIIAFGGPDLDTINSDPDLKAQALRYAGACTTVIKFGLEGIYTDPNGKEYDSPFKDPKVREAFFYGFDAAGWSETVDGGTSSPTWTWIPPGFPGYDAEANATPQFDPARAVKALAESTYGGPDALNALGLKLTYGSSARNQTRSEFLVAKYKEILGVDIGLDPVDATAFTALTKDPKTFPLLARQGWCADYPDQQNWLSVYWRSDTTFAQREGWNDPDFDALVNAADIEADPAKRADLYMEAQRLLLSKHPSAFGYNSQNNWLVKPWVKGIATTPQDSDWAGSFGVLEIDIDTAMMP